MHRIVFNLVLQNPMRLFSCNSSLKSSDTLRKIGVAAATALGMFGEAFFYPNRRTVVFAESHASHDLQHIMSEIVNHAIWHEAGHVLYLGTFAAGVLGSLLTFQSLGEKDSFYIPRPIPAPIMKKCINPKTGMMDDCLRLPNGREIVGQDILRFYSDLQYAKIVKHLEKIGK